MKDMKGNSLNVGDYVVWYDPEEEYRDTTRIWEIYDIKGEIICISDAYGEAEVLPEELLKYKKLE